MSTRGRHAVFEGNAEVEGAQLSTPTDQGCPFHCLLVWDGVVGQGVTMPLKRKNKFESRTWRRFIVFRRYLNDRVNVRIASKASPISRTDKWLRPSAQELFRDPTCMLGANFDGIVIVKGPRYS